MTNKTREQYAAYQLSELYAMLRRADDRADRAETEAQYLTDMFACQEIAAAIAAKETKQ